MKNWQEQILDKNIPQTGIFKTNQKMETHKKRLSLSIEFNNKVGLHKTLRYLISQLHDNKTNNEKILMSGNLLNWDVQKTSLPNHRVEEIDGITCMIIPSKMNKK